MIQCRGCFAGRDNRLGGVALYSHPSKRHGDWTRIAYGRGKGPA